MPSSSAVRESISASLNASRASCATCSTSAREMREATGENLLVGIELAERKGPPLGRGRIPVGIRVDAVHGARGQALVAAAAELRNDDDVGPVIEDRTELI